jgi:hypothetical protein
MENLLQRLLIGSAIALLIVLVANLIALAVLYQPGVAPAGNGVKMVIIQKPDCTDCFNASLYQPELERLGVNFSSTTTLLLGSSQAQKLIDTYKLTRLPAIILSKELGATDAVAANWDKIGTIAADGSYVLQGTNPPYYDLASQQVRGFVSLLYLTDDSCATCYNVTIHRDILARFGMVISDVRTVDISSVEGKALLASYGLDVAPTVLLRGDYALYPGFSQVWTSVGDVAADGTAVFRNVAAVGLPYKNLTSGEVVTPPTG